MVTLRLFHIADPFRPIDMRTFTEGDIWMGRDPAVDWPIDDKACELSRRHCQFRFTHDGVFVRDASANGIFLGQERRRVRRDEDTRLRADDTIYLGQFLVTVEAALAPASDRTGEGVASENRKRVESAIDAPFHAPMLQEPLLSAADFQIREDRSEDHVARNTEASVPDAIWIEAFCAGAAIDPSAFAGEDPLDVARKAGAVYRQSVAGLCDLMSERSSLKSDYQMNRTTVGAHDNNPFKWAEPHRIAVDLLRSGNAPFLSGAGAVRASFEDMKKHILCLTAGSRAALQTVFDETAPAQIEAHAKGQTLLFKADACWRAYKERHAALMSQAQLNADSLFNRAFKAGYEAQVRNLDGLGTVS